MVFNELKPTHRWGAAAPAPKFRGRRRCGAGAAATPHLVPLLLWQSYCQRENFGPRPSWQTPRLAYHGAIRL